MKKIVIIVISIIVCIVGSIQIVRIKTSTIPYDMINVEINEISIEKLSENILQKGDLFHKELSMDMYENPEKYTVIYIKYQMINKSDIVMRNIRYEPSLTATIRLGIKTYNSGNGEYFISLYPGNKQDFEQYIIIEDDGKSNEDIFNLLMSTSVRLKYAAIPKYFYLQDENTGWINHSYGFRIQNAYAKG